MGVLTSEHVSLQATKCAICQTYGGATEVYEANFTSDAFTPAVFSARRIPDRLHYRIVRCDTCALVRSDPIADGQAIAELYSRSGFDYNSEVSNLKATYGRYLSRVEAYRPPGKGSLLEIGCGNGFFLEEAIARGYMDVWGVEPSTAAVDSAPAAIRDRIVCGLMNPELFNPGSFDIICMFQVFDHIAEPAALLDACRVLLKADGLLLILNHDVEAASSRLLGERSPIIDIEHTYLYSASTLSRLLERRGFNSRESGRVTNTYHLQYLSQLLPLPGRIKRLLLDTLRRSRIGSIRISVPLGNLYVIAQKTAHPAP